MVADSLTLLAIQPLNIEHRVGMQLFGTILFVIAVLHTFCSSFILTISKRFPHDSIRGSLLHLLGEVEVVFGLWAGVLVVLWSGFFGIHSSVAYLQGLNFAEPVFVFVIMCISATRPISRLANYVISWIGALIPIPQATGLYLSTLIVGPLLGSVITEPAAMTVTALLLKECFFDRDVSDRFRLLTLAVLFVNISIGGTLTHFAAPPVLMVAESWDWNTPFMLREFGWKGASAVVINALAATFYFRSELARLSSSETLRLQGLKRSEWGLAFSHAVFIIPVVYFSHYIVVLIPLFLFFLGWHAASIQFQDDLKIKESLLVAFFLGGLVTLGNLQDWWLQPILSGLNGGALFWGACGLTAFTDNAALTYLATLVPNLSDTAKYAVVAGAVTGGGLTVIANAPNLAGYSILSPSFKERISPIGLCLFAAPFTLIAAAAFLLLP